MAGVISTVPRANARYWKCKRCGTTITIGLAPACSRGPCPMEPVEERANPKRTSILHRGFGGRRRGKDEGV